MEQQYATGDVGDGRQIDRAGSTAEGSAWRNWSVNTTLVVKDPYFCLFSIKP